MAPPSCPPLDQLQLVFDGARPPHGSTDLLRHLEDCEDCQVRLAAAPPRVEVLPAFRPEVEEETRLVSPAEGGDTAWPRATGEFTDFTLASGGPPVPRRVGPYEVVGVLGHGAMGIVVKAIDPVLNRFVAVKILTPTLAENDDARRRFVREAQAPARIASDHVVPVYGLGEADDRPYLVMQYVRGQDLARRLKRGGPMPLDEALRIGREVAAGLAAAHAVGVVHRDVKPGNVLLEELEAGAVNPGPGGWERVRITDFGLAREDGGPVITRHGVVVGTPKYMSPEQITGAPVDHRTDLYSFGLLLYQLVVGRAPFHATSLVGFLDQHLYAQPTPPSECVPGGVPDWLDQLIIRLLRKQPADRVQTAAEVVRELDEGTARLNLLADRMV
ncbi:MAG: serine/threonine protein kinase [Gemmataceae bacterium]|nr:serine/threonine protein kinase [Gemmataceae bacterium]